VFPDQRILAQPSEKDNNVWVWDYETGERKDNLLPDNEKGYITSFQPMGEDYWLTTVRVPDGEGEVCEGVAHIWHVKQGGMATFQALKGNHRYHVYQHPNGLVIGSGFFANGQGDQSEILFWDSEGGTPIHRVGMKGELVSILKNGNLLTWYPRKSRLYLLDETGKNLLKTIIYRGELTQVQLIGQEQNHVLVMNRQGDVALFSLCDRAQEVFRPLQEISTLNPGVEHRHLCMLSNGALLCSSHQSDSFIEMITFPRRHYHERELRAMLDALEHNSSVQTISWGNWQVDPELKQRIEKAIGEQLDEDQREMRIADIKSLIEELSSSEFDTQRAAAEKLWNLVVNNRDNQILVAELKGIPPAVKLLDNDDSHDLQRIIAHLLANLLLVAENRVLIVEIGGLDGLIRLLDSPDVDVQAGAALALGNLAVDQKNKEKMIAEGVIAKLADLLTSSSLEVARCSAGALWGLVLCDEGRESLAETQGVIQVLLQLLQHGKNDDMSKKVAGVLANLALNGVAGLDLLRTDRVELLVSLLPRVVGEVREQINLILSNLVHLKPGIATEIDKAKVIYLQKGLEGESIPRGSGKEDAGLMRSAAIAVKPRPGHSQVQLKDGFLTSLFTSYPGLKIFLQESCLAPEGVPGDGNCFFESIGRLIGLEHVQVRAEALQYLKDHSELHVGIDDINGFLERMGRLEEWAEGAIIGAAAKYYNIHLLVLDYRSDSEIGFVACNDFPELDTFILLRTSRLTDRGEVQGHFTPLRQLRGFSEDQLSKHESKTDIISASNGGGGAAATLRSCSKPTKSLDPIRCYGKGDFELIGPRVGGSSLCSGRFKKRSDQSIWFGKSGVRTTVQKAKEEVCLEKIANDIYGHFGVPIPETVLAQLNITEEASQHFPDERTDTVYLLSRCIEDSFPLGSIPDFNGGSVYCLRSERGVFPVVGLGRILAVACLIRDKDAIGGSGGNVVCQVIDGEAICFKIDAGYAFDNQPALEVGDREICVATMHENKVLPFNRFPSLVRQEFLETLAQIVNTSDDVIERFFVRQGAECLGDGQVAGLQTLLTQRRNRLARVYGAELNTSILRRVAELTDAAPIRGVSLFRLQYSQQNLGFRAGLPGKGPGVE
jgi:hypothetical protein